MAVGDAQNGFNAGKPMPPGSPRLRAALLGAHYTAWRRDANSHSILVPSGLDRLLPMSAARVQSAVEGYEEADLGDPPNNYLRSSIAGALVPATPDKKQRWEERRWNADLQSVLGEQKYNDFNSDPLQRPGPCMAYLCMREKCLHHARGAHQHVYPRAQRKIVSTHTPTLVFDPDTWITTATEDVTFDGVRPEVAKELFVLADPRRWHKAVPNFFKASEMGQWAAGAWKRSLPYALDTPNGDDEGPKDFQLFENVTWQFTPELDGGGINILEITDFEVERGVSIRYDYRLYHCLQTKFLTTWEVGGLDVDEGSYEATLKGDDLRIKAQKSLRYTQQPNLPPGFAGFLNLLAPSITSLLMRQLAHDSVLEFLLSKEPLAVTQKGRRRIKAPASPFPAKEETAVRRVSGHIPGRAQANGRPQRSTRSRSQPTSAQTHRSNKQSGGAGRR